MKWFCYTCADAGDDTEAVIAAEVEDEGNGWQTWHYCEDCADALGIEDGDEIPLSEDGDEIPLSED